jgi:hypothetical protein
VIVDAELCTHNPRIWAAGDVTGQSQFVYVAGAHGALIGDNAATPAARWTPQAPPPGRLNRPAAGNPWPRIPTLAGARAYPSLRAAQADWVREVISTTSRPLLIASDGAGEEVLRAANRIGLTTRVM